MKSLFFSLVCFSTSLWAAPPIEGGRNAPVTSFDYVDIIKMTGNTKSECTGTKVSATLVLTAAHCVYEFDGKNFHPLIQAGNNILGVGVVVKTTIHPHYQEAFRKRKLNPQDKKASVLATLYDVAFVEIKQKTTQRTMPYPKIVSSETQFDERKKMELSGYGLNEAIWEDNGYNFRSTQKSFQVADNEWVNCPLDYFNNDIKALEKLKDDLQENLSIKAKRIHSIVSGQEKIATDDKGMILPGDSGSPALERDKNNQLTITGVASSMVTYDEGSGEAKLEIEVDGELVVSKEFEKFPSNWGLRTKADTEFSEIQNILQAEGLIGHSGFPKAGVVVRRKYTRVSRGNYADLSHPDNQKFIKSVMK